MLIPNGSPCVSISFCLQHKMFYKTKSTSRRTSGSPTVTAPNDGLSELRDPRRSTNLIGPLKNLFSFLFFVFAFFRFRITTVLHLLHRWSDVWQCSKRSPRPATEIRGRHQRSQLCEARSVLSLIDVLDPETARRWRKIFPFVAWESSFKKSYKFRTLANVFKYFVNL